MKYLSLALVFACAVALILLGSGPATSVRATGAVFNPDTDTFIADNIPTTVNSDNVELRVRGSLVSYNESSLLHFDLSSIPSSSVVTTATLTLHVIARGNSNSATVSIYNVLRDYSSANETTWEQWLAGEYWTTAGAKAPARIAVRPLTAR